MQTKIEERQEQAKKAKATWAMIEAVRMESQRIEAERRRQKQIQAAISKVPPRFLSKTFDDFRIDYPQQSPVKNAATCYVETFLARLLEAANLVFIGKPGTGKTFLALIMYQALVKAGFMVEYQPSLHFLRLLQEKQYESYSALESQLSWYQRLPFLIIDEATEGCGKGAYPADWERHLLRMLIDVRYQAKRCTLMISNRSKTELIDRVGEPTLDRFYEGGAILAFNWPSYRKRQG